MGILPVVLKETRRLQSCCRRVKMAVFGAFVEMTPAR